MNNPEITKAHRGYYAVIPSYVRYCKELEPSAKLLYGELTALSNEYGYCWASNDYFAKLYDVDTRTIQRWLETLKKNGFIEVEIKKEGMKSSRKIRICEEIQKMFATRQNCHPRDDTRHDKNVVLDTAKMPPIIIQDTNIKEPSLVPPLEKLKCENPKPEKGEGGGLFQGDWEFMQNVDLDEHSKKRIRQYPIEIVKKVLDYVNDPENAIRDFERAIFYYLKSPERMIKHETLKEEDKHMDEMEKTSTRKTESALYCKKCPQTDKNPVVNTLNLEFRHSGVKVYFDNPDFAKLANEQMKSYAAYASEYIRNRQKSNTTQ